MIDVNNLSKKYHIVKAGSKAFRTGGIFTKSNEIEGEENYIWALKDISLHIKAGEVAGIIGRNGSGKSTLLKLLSRITAPTSGSIKIGGRVASLLEVGSGFHPELTGRENIYLSGAVFGMKRREIDKRFDEIVFFSGVSDFIDVPVKRYSSGMYVRLAFSVAVFLNNDILIIDEILAVGDIEFQNLCINAIHEKVNKTGRTAIVVSHNMEIVSKLCTSVTCLENGRILHAGKKNDVIQVYRNQSSPFRYFADSNLNSSFIKAAVIDEEKLIMGKFQCSIMFSSPDYIKPNVGLIIKTDTGIPVFGSTFLSHPQNICIKSMKTGIAEICINNLCIHSGKYFVDIYLKDNERLVDVKHDFLFFEYVSDNKELFNVDISIVGALNIAAKWSLAEA